MQTTIHFGFHRDSTRKLALKKETLRQLTDGELRQIAGGGVSTVSVAPLHTSLTSASSVSTSVLSSGTSVINPSGG